MLDRARKIGRATKRQPGNRLSVLAATRRFRGKIDAMASGGVILFDGTCAFCEGTVKFVARRDRAGYFRFGASQSVNGQALLAAHGLTREMTRSMVLVEDGRVYLRSTATLRIAAHLPFPWKLARHLLWIPEPIRDGFYRVIAAVRHRIAGRSNACDVPPPEIRARLI